MRDGLSLKVITNVNKGDNQDSDTLSPSKNQQQNKPNDGLLLRKFTFVVPLMIENLMFSTLDYILIHAPPDEKRSQMYTLGRGERREHFVNEKWKSRAFIRVRLPDYDWSDPVSILELASAYRFDSQNQSQNQNFAGKKLFLRVSKAGGMKRRPAFTHVMPNRQSSSGANATSLSQGNYSKSVSPSRRHADGTSRYGANAGQGQLISKDDAQAHTTSKLLRASSIRGGASAAMGTISSPFADLGSTNAEKGGNRDGQNDSYSGSLSGAQNYIMAQVLSSDRSKKSKEYTSTNENATNSACADIHIVLFSPFWLVNHFQRTILRLKAPKMECAYHLNPSEDHTDLHNAANAPEDMFFSGPETTENNPTDGTKLGIYEFSGHMLEFSAPAATLSATRGSETSSDSKLLQPFQVCVFRPGHPDQWSAPVSVNLAPNAVTALSVQKKNTNSKARSGLALLLIHVLVDTAPGRFFRTKILRFLPRVVLVNQLLKPSPLFLRQAGVGSKNDAETSFQIVSSQCSYPFHRTDDDKPALSAEPSSSKKKLKSKQKYKSKSGHSSSGNGNQSCESSIPYNAHWDFYWSDSTLPREVELSLDKKRWSQKFVMEGSYGTHYIFAPTKSRSDKTDQKHLSVVAMSSRIIAGCVTVITFRSVSREVEAHMLSAVKDFKKDNNSSSVQPGGILWPWVLKKSKTRLRRQIVLHKREIQILEVKMKSLQAAVENHEEKTVRKKHGRRGSSKSSPRNKKHLRFPTRLLLPHIKKKKRDVHILDISIEKATNLVFSKNLQGLRGQAQTPSGQNDRQMMFKCSVFIERAAEVVESTVFKPATKIVSSKSTTGTVKSGNNSGGSSASVWQVEWDQPLRLTLPVTKEKKHSQKIKPKYQNILVIKLYRKVSSEGDDELGSAKIDLSGMVLNLMDKKVLALNPDKSCELLLNGTLHITVKQKREQQAQMEEAFNLLWEKQAKVDELVEELKQVERQIYANDDHLASNKPKLVKDGPQISKLVDHARFQLDVEAVSINGQLVDPILRASTNSRYGGDDISVEAKYTPSQMYKRPLTVAKRLQFKYNKDMAQAELQIFLSNKSEFLGKVSMVPGKTIVYPVGESLWMWLPFDDRDRDRSTSAESINPDDTLAPSESTIHGRVLIRLSWSRLDLKEKVIHLNATANNIGLSVVGRGCELMYLNIFHATFDSTLYSRINSKLGAKQTSEPKKMMQLNLPEEDGADDPAGHTHTNDAKQQRNLRSKHRSGSELVKKTYLQADCMVKRSAHST